MTAPQNYNFGISKTVFMRLALRNGRSFVDD